ncbi:MAG TPA: response regulator [Gemmatimonadaceae bacterium]|nr:response regulator [Gemmatimonadaceae bacterium]
MTHVLIADDDPNILMVFSAFLKSEPLTLDVAADGRAAVEKISARVPALVILDMDMPVMNGYEAARIIRAVHSAEALPIIGVTGHDDPDAERKCLEAGCTSYLAKPVRRAALVQAVGAALGARRGKDLRKSPAFQEVPDALVSRFLAQVGEDVSRAFELVADGRFGEVGRIGHQIRGTAGTLGFPRIGGAGVVLEMAAAGGEADDVVAALRALEREVKRQ